MSERSFWNRKPALASKAETKKMRRIPERKYGQKLSRWLENALAILAVTGAAEVTEGCNPRVYGYGSADDVYAAEYHRAASQGREQSWWGGRLQAQELLRSVETGARTPTNARPEHFGWRVLGQESGITFQGQPTPAVQIGYGIGREYFSVTDGQFQVYTMHSQGTVTRLDRAGDRSNEHITSDITRVLAQGDAFPVSDVQLEAVPRSEDSHTPQLEHISQPIVLRMRIPPGRSAQDMVGIMLVNASRAFWRRYTLPVRDRNEEPTAIYDARVDGNRVQYRSSSEQAGGLYFVKANFTVERGDDGSEQVVLRARADTLVGRRTLRQRYQ